MFQKCPVCTCIAMIIIAHAIGVVTATNVTDQYRFAGTALQVAGLATVAFGIQKLRRDLKRPEIKELVETWFNDHKKAFQELISSHYAKKGEGGLWVPPDATAPQEQSRKRPQDIKDRVAALEEDFDSLQQAEYKAVSHLQEMILEAERTLSATDAKLVKTIEDVALGGITINVVGLVWLLLGVICTSIPDVLAKYTPHAWRILCNSI